MSQSFPSGAGSRSQSEVSGFPAVSGSHLYSAPTTQVAFSKKADTRVPAYCHHKAKNQAYVRLSGDFIYLGQYGSPESVAAYQRAVAEWLSRGRTPKPPSEGPSVNDVLLSYWRWAETYYVDAEGKPSREMASITWAIRPLKDLYGGTSASEFGPIALKAVRQSMLANGLCRNVINQRIGCLKRIFKWAVGEELIPPSVYQGLAAVDGLRKGHTTARETQPIRPVPDEHVEAVLPFLPPTVRTMVRLQRLTGMRSGELVILRTCDVDLQDAVWLYRPSRHKTANRGHERIVRIGPRAKDILRPFLQPDSQAFVFSPSQAQKERSEIKRERRKSKVQPSQVCRAKEQRKRLPGRRYTTRSYYRAVLYGIEAAVRAGVLAAGVRWHPHQLRHSYGTQIRRERGLDAARALMGHRTLSQAEEYAEIDTMLASKVAAEIG